ncbi:class I SAM-dependent methyltransferase [Alphaproteobacteria bacterium]|nr:class I SAM-dependent methyltransferase [Alphaproteobacteria bacterium]
MKAVIDFKKLLLSGEAKTNDWLSLKHAVSEDYNSLPTHLKLYISDLKQLEACGLKKSDIVIFDHGCGSGISILFLLANGYENVFGVDPKTHKYDVLNYSISILLGRSVKPFMNYMSGNKIDLPNGSVNYIFSNQVIEHLSDNDLVSYLSEEQRIKSDTSIIRHSFPSRNTFFETHTKTIFLHWLMGRSSFNRLFGNRKREWLENNLFLRWDHVHEKEFVKHIGPCVQENINRAELAEQHFEEKAVKKFLRIMFHKMLAVPVFTSPLKKFYKVFATKEYVQRNISLK